MEEFKSESTVSVITAWAKFIIKIITFKVFNLEYYQLSQIKILD